jgi:hypothetical protein
MLTLYGVKAGEKFVKGLLNEKFSNSSFGLI